MTRTCVYYDLDEISADDVRRARSRGPDADHFALRGATWPKEFADRPPARVLNSRDFDYQARLMDWIDRMFAALTATASGRPHRPFQDTDLLEIVRFHFLFNFAPVAQRWWALSEIVQSKSPNRLIWVAPRARLGQLRALSSPNIPTRVELLPASDFDGLRAVLHNARRIAGPLRRRFRRWFLRPRSTAPRPSLTNSGIVFVEYFPNNVKGILPVAKALQDRHGIEPSWLALRTPVAEALRNSGVPAAAVTRCDEDPVDERTPFTAAERACLEAALDELPHGIYQGPKGLDGREYLKPAVAKHLTALLEQARYWLAGLTAAFDHLRPQCVVSTSYSSIPGRAAAMACAQRGGKSVYLQHGLFPDRSFFTRFCNDVLLLWGDSNRRFMIEQGISPDRVQVVGATNYDELIARSRDTAPKPVPQPGAPLVVALMASRTGGAALSYSAADTCVTNVARAVAAIESAHLIVKIHPGDKTGMVERAVGKLPGCTIVKAGNSQDVILQSDIVIVVSSTTGLEACVADKPLIVLEPVGVPNFGTYAQYGAALMVPLNGDCDWERIADAIQRLQGGPAMAAELALGRRRLVDDMLNGGRGDAANLAATAIAGCIGVSEPIAAHPFQGV